MQNFSLFPVYTHKRIQRTPTHIGGRNCTDLCNYFYLVGFECCSVCSVYSEFVDDLSSDGDVSKTFRDFVNTARFKGLFTWPSNESGFHGIEIYDRFLLLLGFSYVLTSLHFNWFIFERNYCIFKTVGYCIHNIYIFCTRYYVRNMNNYAVLSTGCLKQN